MDADGSCDGGLTPFQINSIMVSDENIPSPLPFSSIDDVAVQDKPNEVRIGPMTRARAKLLGQQVNSLLVEFDVCDNENFILPVEVCPRQFPWLLYLGLIVR